MILKRLKSNSGETISEVLVGVLIVGLATVLFATVISVATSTSLKSVDRTTATYEQLTAVDSLTERTGQMSLEITPVSGLVLDATFTVYTYSSTPGGPIDTTYTFTRYLLPDFAGTTGGGA